MTPKALDQCPFCGGTPQISSAGFGYHTIHCEACRVVQPGKPRDEAIAAWNRRLVCEDVRPEVVEIYPDCQDPGCESCNAARSSKPETAEVVEALEKLQMLCDCADEVNGQIDRETESQRHELEPEWSVMQDFAVTLLRISVQ